MPDGTTGAENGITGNYQGGNPIIIRAMLAFTAIAWYNSAELIILVFVVFKRYSGLYFWSLLVTSAAIIPYCVGAWGKQVGITDYPLAMIILSTAGWLVMVPGQSLVLYSRLHCITQDQRLLKGILIMIIVDTIILSIPTSVLAFGSNTHKHSLFAPGYAVMEKIQMTWFTVQELIISAVYLIEVRRALSVIKNGRVRKMMFELVAINVAIILMDVALLAVEYLSMYQIEVTMKPMVYSIKLKLEFGVLSKLVKIATSRSGVYDWDTSEGSEDVQHTYKSDNAVSPSFLTTVPTNSTYNTVRPFKTAIGTIARNDTGFNSDVEKYHDFEMNVSFSQAEPLPKPAPVQQTEAQQASQRSSTEILYPGRLG